MAYGQIGKQEVVYTKESQSLGERDHLPAVNLKIDFVYG